MPKNSAKVLAKRAGRRDDIVRIAARLFEQRGYEKVSLLDVAREFGKGRSTIYEYFRDKNALLAECLEQEMAAYHGKIVSIMTAPGTLKDRLRTFVRVQLVYGTAHVGYSRLFRALTRDASSLATKTRAKIGKLHAEVYGILTQEIRSAIQRKEIKTVPVELTMQLLINATSLPIRSTDDPEKVCVNILNLFWSGMERS